METEYISRKELIVWLMPYVHTGEKVDPEALFADIRAMKAADLERRVDELEAELRDSDGADAERLGEFAEEVIRQFAYRVKTNGHCAFTAGGLSVLEEAFDIVGWDDPHWCQEEEEGSVTTLGELAKEQLQIPEKKRAKISVDGDLWKIAGILGNYPILVAAEDEKAGEE